MRSDGARFPDKSSRNDSMIDTSQKLWVHFVRHHVQIQPLRARV